MLFDVFFSICDVALSPSPLIICYLFPCSLYICIIAHVLAAGVADSLGISRRHDFLFLIFLIRLFTPYFTSLGGFLGHGQFLGYRRQLFLLPQVLLLTGNTFGTVF